ncbi:MAG: adenylate kinase [Cyanobacteria bacterium P01_A01_bin.45]
MPRFIFLGAPGAGKGTQATVLAESLQIPHISTGDLLRQAVANQTELGKQAKAYMDKGELVPDSLVINLIRDRLNQADSQKGWILDGFPRNTPQAQALEELLEVMEQNYDIVINFDVSVDSLVTRMLERGRKDDNEETIRTRLEVYREETAPLIDYYRSRGALRVFDGNLTVAEISRNVQDLSNSFLKTQKV